MCGYLTEQEGESFERTDLYIVLWRSGAGVECDTVELKTTTIEYSGRGHW